MMPKEISDEEYEKFKELVEKEEERKKIEKELRKKLIGSLAERVEEFLNTNKQYGPMEAHALKFLEFINNDFKRNKSNELWFKWSELQLYLTDICLEKNVKGLTDLKRSFRNNLKDRGVCFKIDRKYDWVKIYKCKRRKVRKNY